MLYNNALEESLFALERHLSKNGFILRLWYLDVPNKIERKNFSLPSSSIFS